MECSESGAIRAEELDAYLAGEPVRPAVVEHLAHCQHCSLQLATYRRVELELIRKFYRWDCPPNVVLGEYQIGMLSQAQIVAVKNHLKRCMLCTAEVATLTNFLANEPVLAQSLPVVEKVASVSPAATNNHHVKRALDQLRSGDVIDHARRIAAILVPQQPRLAYQRSNASSQSVLWPRRYATEDVTISVQVERDPVRKDTLQLIGFVAQKGTTVGPLQGNTVRLSTSEESGKTIYTQTIDELGNFVFPALVPSSYTLELQLPEGTVVIDQLSLALQE